MKRIISVLLFSCIVGCGGSSSPTADNKVQPDQATPTVAATGTPSVDEASRSIREFFSGPDVRFSNVQVEKVSDPVEAPKEAVSGWGSVWVYSVTMNCDNVLGFRQQNKNWLVLMSRENGRATVKDYYHNLERVQQSPLGKEWFARKGFAEPAIVHE